MNSGRALHRAARLSLSERFTTDWCRRSAYAFLHEAFVAELERLSSWPTPEEYDGLAARVPRPALPERGPPDAALLPRFVTQDRAALERHGGYEKYVAETRSVPTRPKSWHDFFNMAVWAHFPRLRWALNSIHVDARLGPVDPRNGRAPAQNVAAQLDESGLIVASSSPELLDELAALRFKHVFWQRREEFLATSRAWIIGHGMLESLLSPHPRLSGKAVFLALARAPERYDASELRASVDARVAAVVDGWRDVVPALAPLPLLGVPGYADNASAEFYERTDYFRFERRPRL